MAEAILTSWRFDPLLLGVLALAASLYTRGWLRMRAQTPHRYTPERLAAYLAGLATLLVSLDSPLDAFGNLLLEAHMVQHLLLIVVAPPLLLLGQPVLPLMRALPRAFVRNGLGPFLRWKALRRAGRLLTHPVFCWLAMTGAIVFWHMPRWYDLGLGSATWHGIEHACFFYAAVLFWWPVIGVWPGRPQWPRLMMIPYLVLADMVNTALSAWLVFSSGVVYQTYAMAPRLGGITAMDDQSTAGAIMWVPGSIAYLIPAILLTWQALNSSRAQQRAEFVILPARPADWRQWDLLRTPVIGRALGHRHFRRVLQALMLCLAIAVMADGFRGPQVAPINLAGVLPWTYWRGLTVIALLAGGNFFCMVCPFTLPRSLARRLLPSRGQWPVALRSKWLAGGLIVIYLWAYEVFSLWNSPWWTAWIVAGYFVAAFIVDGSFQGASFCKYVCPIGQFHFVNSLLSPLEVKVRSAEVCKSCETHDCIRGNAGTPGCATGLFQPLKKGNMDCTFCLDCVHACPVQNVGIVAIPPASALLANRPNRADMSALAWALTFAAIVNAGMMAGPVISAMHLLQAALGLVSLWPVTTVLYISALIVAPLLLSWTPSMRPFGPALIPLGFSMWVAHFSWHLITGAGSIVSVIDRFTRGSQPSPGLSGEAAAWLRTGQILVLDGGLLISLYLVWRLASRVPSRTFPWVGAAIGIYAAAIWVVFQPMQMRGMVM